MFRADAVRLSSAAESSWTGELRLAESEAPTSGAWIARVERLEQTLGGVRVHTAEPPIAVDLPTEAVALLHLRPGTPVRLRVEAADVRLQPM